MIYDILISFCMSKKMARNNKTAGNILGKISGDQPRKCGKGGKLKELC
jgi:hypothetical protein